MKFCTPIVVATLATTVFVSSALAQYEVTWYTVDSGGTMDASGGGYSTDGTVGQPDPGKLIGGGYTVDGGFWVLRSHAPRLPSDPTHQALKNRYITIDTTANASQSVAYQVSLSSMRRCSGDLRRACTVDADCPGVCDNDNDLQCSDDEICGGGVCVPTDPCIEHSDVGSVLKYVDTPYVNSCIPLADCATQWFATLVDAPVYRVWTEDVLHILGCGIVPVADYEIRATTDGSFFSDPLVVGTIAKPQVHYADCVGPVESGSFTPADGFTNVTDVQAYLIANQGGASAPHTTWVDLHSSSAPVVPQQILNVGDLQTIKFGFLGQTYVETPGHENPGDCPP